MPLRTRIFSGWNPDRRELLGVVALGLLLALSFTGPALLADTPTLLGTPESEVFSGVWVLWWGRETMLETWAAPVWAELLNAPKGRLVHCLPLMDAFLSLPLHRLLRAHTVYLLVVMGHVVFATVSAAWFLRRFGAGPWTALPGIVAFVTTPTFVGVLSTGPVESVGIGWMPFTIVVVLEALARGGRLRVALAAVVLGGCFLANPYYFVFAAFNLAWMAPLELRGRPSRAWWVRVAIIGAGALIVMMPQIWAIQLSPGLSPRDADPSLDAEMRIHTHSHDLIGMLLPVDGLNRGVSERRVYIGFSLVCLALAGVRRPGSRRWWIFGALGLIYALGVQPRVAGMTVGTSPFAYTLNRLPVFDQLSHPFRVLPLVVLALGVLGALALQRASPERRRLLGIGAAIIVGIDLLAVVPERGMPPTVSARTPAFYHQLAAQAAPGSMAVLDLVAEDVPNPSRTLLHQTIHRQKLIVDLKAPDSPWAENAAVLLAQWNMELPFPFGPDQICSEAVDLTWAGVRYVVIHRVEGRNARSGFLERCGFPVVSETDDTLVLDLTSRADQ